MKKNTKHIDAVIILVLIAICILIGFSVYNSLSDDEEAVSEVSKYENIEDTPLDDYANKRIGVMTGSLYENLVQERFPEAPLSLFNNQPDMSAALSGNKIDIFFIPELTAKAFVKADNSLTYLNETFAQLNYAYAFPKDNSGFKLCDEMNSFLSELRKSGEYDKLVEKWLGDDESTRNMDSSGLTGEKGTLRFATTGTFEPFSYVKDGECVGFEVEIAMLFCKKYGYDLEISLMDFGAIIPGLTSNRYDFAGCNITITEERAQSIHFSDPDYTAKAVGMVRKTSGSGTEEKLGFFEGIASSFEKTFIKEERWKLILEGIFNTILITVMSLIFGTGLAFLICIFRRTESKLAIKICDIYVRILSGTPMVVFLMILYYIIFSKSGMSAIIVAIIGFTLNSGAAISEIMNSGIDSIEKGQNEAALALGFTERQSFYRFIFPQAVVRFLPVYKGAAVNLLKNTSVVGYIAIQDLTKMSDLIRSRTYEAFFPLITTAIIYFLISWIMVKILSKVEIKMDPNTKKKKVYDFENE